ncbi:MAG: TRAP transporter small permease [Deltaproteobacteria bacterium]|nr:TRAP transporter small permease [Deltaproteobacteria bacterium]
MLIKIGRILNIITIPAARWANYIGAAVLTAIMALTGIDVIGRYFLNKPLSGSFEITELLMAVMISLGLAYCTLEQGNVRVDILTQKLSRRGQAIANLGADIVFLVLSILITWQTVYRVQSFIDKNLTTNVLYIPIFPFVIVVALGFAILCLVLLRDAVEHLQEATSDDAL